jgi:hypothetical protein
MQHLDEGTIHTWLDGELSAAEAAEAERHIAECAECAAAVAEARGMIAGASRIVSALDGGVGAMGSAVPRQIAKPMAPRSAWRSLRLTPSRAALAASLLVAAGALLTIRHDTPEKMVPAQTAVMASPAAAVAPAMDSVASSKPPTRTAVRTPISRDAAEPAHADSISRPSAPTAVGLPAASGAGASAMPKAVAPPASAAVAAQPTPAPAAAAPVSVAADARPEVQRAVLDSLTAKTRGAVTGAENLQRRLQSTMQLQNVVTTGASETRASDVLGCYQIKPDSAALSHFLPERFALDRAPAAGKADSNVVRAVTADGRMDSVVTGSNWVQLSADKALIRSIVGTKQQSVSLQLTSLGGVSGQAMTAGRTYPIHVSRTSCRP